MFITALVIIAINWRQPKCPSTDKWINKVWHNQAMEYYLAIKRNEVLMHATIWMNTENFMPHENVSQKRLHNILFHLYVSLV